MSRISFVPSSEAIARAEEQQREFQNFLQSDEYLSAIRAETEGRDLAFIDLPSTICGFALRQLTALDLLNLSVLRSPFLASSFIDGRRKPCDVIPWQASREFCAEHILIPSTAVAAFLWVQSVEFVPVTGFKSRLKWKRFMRGCRPLRYGESCEAVRKYLSEAMVDKPSGGSKCSAPIASWIASSVAFLAMKFHWSERDILNLPLARMFQYERAILAGAGQKHSLCNRSDALKAQWLKQRRERN